jgi:hypothetical protein
MVVVAAGEPGVTVIWWARTAGAAITLTSRPNDNKILASTHIAPSSPCVKYFTGKGEV